MTVSTVNREGQVTIPKEIREKLGIKEGDVPDLVHRSRKRKTK